MTIVLASLAGLGIIGCILLGFVVRNLIIQNVELTDFAEYGLERAYETYKRLKELDSRGAFAADDEVGVTFKEILYTVRDYAEFLGVELEKEIDDELQKE